jgi:hypothetical protein
MRVRFLHDHQGRETEEIWYETGMEGDVTDAAGLQLIAQGHAEQVQTAPAVKAKKGAPVIITDKKEAEDVG